MVVVILSKIIVPGNAIVFQSDLLLQEVRTVGSYAILTIYVGTPKPKYINFRITVFTYSVCCYKICVINKINK